MKLPLTLSYRPTLAEQIEAARHYQRSTRKHQVYRVLSILAVAAAAWSLATAGPHPLALVWVALAAFTWFDPFPLLMIWLSFRGSAGAPPYQATLDEQGVTFEGAGQRTARPWARYQRLVETPHTLVLVYGGWAFSVIPRRAVGDEAAQRQLAELLRGRIGG